ncbi:MAG: outer membrane lipoprotein carrier protein LolA [Proteobacteria bacterium]|nr:outer membrane lipoprotein carrier protein LolA [Pseudomonadota bacterium]
MRWLIRGIFIACVAVAHPVRGTETDTLALIGAQIEQHAVVRADFVQSKQMAALKRPLVTSGRLVFSRRHGVLWQIEQPYRMSYVLGEDRIVQIGADGVRRERGMRDVPGLAQVGRVFRALLGANPATLREVFEVAVHGDPARWDIALQPRQAQLAQFLGTLRLAGGRFVDAIDIVEASGDTTQIRFRNSQGTDAPDAAELQLFVPGASAQ